MTYRLAALLLLFLLIGHLSPAVADPLTIVQFSDIHYGNEEYQPKAWDKAWNQGVLERPDMAVFTGDQVDNKCTRPEFIRHLETFIGDLHSRLETTRIPAVFCLGNNDVVDNYQSSPDDLKLTLTVYRKYFGADFYLDDLGNGAYPYDVGGCRWLSLNSVVFSPKDHYDGRAAQATQTLDWLAAQMDKCPPRQSVVLIMHVPPVKDILDDKLAWFDDDLARLAAILEKHPGPVLILAGHFHRNEIHALRLTDTRAVPVLLAGSLSGKFGGAPDWRIYRADLSATSMGTIQYEVRYPLQDDWTTHYQIDRPSDMASYQDWIQHLSSSEDLYPRYMLDLYAHNAKAGEWAAADSIRQGLLREFVQGVPALR